jgi:nitrite reductase/ring-hydroxylating ferredoxin subunit
MNCKELLLANTSDLRAWEVKEVSVGETKILLARGGDRFHTVAAACPNYVALSLEVKA